jgi:hypothetical protein
MLLRLVAHKKSKHLREAVMRIIKEVLLCLLLAAGTAFFLSLVMLARDADTTVKAVPAEITATRSAVLAEVHSDIQSTRRELLATVNTQATAIQRTADHRLASIQHMVDARTAQALQIADSRLIDVTGAVKAAQADLHPVLANSATLTANAAALTKDAQDFLDDSYWDLKSSIESATVAATSIAQTSEMVRNAAPQVVASVQGIAKSADDVAADVKKEADAVTAPQKWWQKILGPVYTVGRLVADFY